MINLLRRRRSVRKFKPVQIEQEKLDLLIESILRAPSSRGYNPWEFVIVDNYQTLSDLSRSKLHGSEFLKNSVLAVAVLGDEKRSDVWIEDCSIASIILQLTAEDLGLGSCWVQIRNRNHSEEISSERFVQQLLQIPSHMRVLSIIGIGYPDETKETLKEENLQFHKVHLNCYN